MIVLGFAIIAASIVFAILGVAKVRCYQIARGNE